MNTRLSITKIADDLRTALAAGFVDEDDEPIQVHVGTTFDRDYLTLAEVALPGVWVGDQRMTGNPDTSGSRLYRQRVKVEIPVRLIVRRAEDGASHNEAQLTALFNAVADALKDYKPEGATTRLTWEAARGAAPGESLLTTDLVFACFVEWQRPFPSE